VATVVMKLFQIIPANCAFFGQKDYQQTLVIRRMVEDLNVPVQIVVCPIVRESDGLALSSRNVYLSADQRRQALSLSRALRHGRDLFAGGELDAKKIVSTMRRVIDEASGDIMPDYLILADPLTLEESAEANQETIALVAAQVGATRLIDNHVLSHPWLEPLV